MKRGFILGMMSLAIVACHHQAKTRAKQTSIFVVKLRSSVRHYYFSGQINPLKTRAVLSPVDGRVERLNFVYGQRVLKGQQLAVINSPKLMDNLRDAVTDYLTKKSSFLSQQQSFQGTKALHKAGVIDQEDYQNAYNQYQNSVLSYYQEQYHLKRILDMANVPVSTIESLSVSKMDRVKQLFDEHYNHVAIKAPSAGVALFPLADDARNSDSNEPSMVGLGSAVQKNQLLVSIGDLSGLSINILVGEVDVNALHPGMPAVITGEAFPGIQLHGKVTYVATQAQPTNNGANTQSQFAVHVTIPNISKANLQHVHVGMTAKVDIQSHTGPQLSVPIKAVHQHNGRPTVNVKMPSGQTKKVSVKTGDTSLTSVIIQQGLKAGQRVVVDD